MATEKQEAFDYSGFVAKQGGGSAAQYAGDEIVYTQGDPADALFYIASGAVKVTIISEYGKRRERHAGRDRPVEWWAHGNAGLVVAAGRAARNFCETRFRRADSKGLSACVYGSDEKPALKPWLSLVWLGDLDSNQDSRSQSPMFYR